MLDAERSVVGVGELVCAIDEGIPVFERDAGFLAMKERNVGVFALSDLWQTDNIILGFC